MASYAILRFAKYKSPAVSRIEGHNVLSGRLNDAPLLRLFDIQRLPEGGGEANYPA